MLIKLLNPKYYFKTFKKIISFICSPQNVLDKSYSFKAKLIYVLIARIIAFVLFILSGLVTYFFQNIDLL